MRGRGGRSACAGAFFCRGGFSSTANPSPTVDLLNGSSGVRSSGGSAMRYESLVVTAIVCTTPTRFTSPTPLPRLTSFLNKEVDKNQPSKRLGPPPPQAPIPQ